VFGDILSADKDANEAVDAEYELDRPMKKEKVIVLWQAEMRMIRWMCGVKVTDWFTSSEPRGKLERGGIFTALQ